MLPAIALSFERAKVVGHSLLNTAPVLAPRFSLPSPKFQMQTLSDLRTFLESPHRIVLISHRNPDGDAIGSTTGMRRFLEEMGHTCSIIVPSDYPGFLSFLEGISDVLVYDNDAEAADAVLDKAELIMLLDFNSLERVDKLGEYIATLETTPRVLIDHHLFPENIADVIVSDSTASSTCELVYRTIVDMGWKARVTPHIVEPLMTGILTDTGGFKYAINPTLFEVVSELYDIGVDNEKLQDAIFNSYTEKQLRLLGHCLANRMELLPEYRAGLITLSKRDYENFDIQRGDTEGIVNYLLKLEGVELAAFITEQPTITKLSLRSKGDVNVQELARDNFKGGGHKNASGGYSHSGLRSTVQKFKSALAARTEQPVS